MFLGQESVSFSIAESIRLKVILFGRKTALPLSKTTNWPQIICDVDEKRTDWVTEG